MIERTIYTCEYCGKVFDDLEECATHEIEERFRSVRSNNSLQCWDKDGNVVELKGPFDVERVVYVIAKTAEARKLFDQMEEQEGFQQCYVFNNEDCDTLMYYDFNDEWCSWQAEYDEIIERRRKLKNFPSVVYSKLKDMVEVVKDIDSAMTELKKVTDETDETYQKFLDTVELL